MFARKYKCSSLSLLHLVNLNRLILCHDIQVLKNYHFSTFQIKLNSKEVLLNAAELSVESET